MCAHERLAVPLPMERWETVWAPQGCQWEEVLCDACRSLNSNLPLAGDDLCNASAHQSVIAIGDEAAP